MVSTVDDEDEVNLGLSDSELDDTKERLTIALSILNKLMLAVLRI